MRRSTARRPFFCVRYETALQNQTCTLTHRHFAQDKGMDVQKLLGCWGRPVRFSLVVAATVIPADASSTTSLQPYPCLVHAPPKHRDGHIGALSRLSCPGRQCALLPPRPNAMALLLSSGSSIILTHAAPFLLTQTRALSHTAHHTMGDSVRDMMRQAAKQKQKKADALAAALKNSKGKEQVGRCGGG